MGDLMLLPLSLGLLHAMEPDHVAVVAGVSLHQDQRGAWKVGLAFGLSHMLAVAILAVLSAFLGHALFGDAALNWLDRAAWVFVMLLGLWNLAAALGIRSVRVHAHSHHHGVVEHEHPHLHSHKHPVENSREHPLENSLDHTFHHSAAWLGAFFGLGGVRGFLTLSRNAGSWPFVEALLLFGLGITSAFIVLSWISGWIASRAGTTARWQRLLFGVSGVGNVLVGLWLLLKP